MTLNDRIALELGRALLRALIAEARTEQAETKLSEAAEREASAPSPPAST